MPQAGEYAVSRHPTAPATGEPAPLLNLLILRRRGGHASDRRQPCSLFRVGPRPPALVALAAAAFDIADRLLGIAGGPVARLGIAVALVGEVVALVGGTVALVGEVVAFVGGPLPLVGEVVALVSGPLPFVGVVLGPVQGGGASGQPGLGGHQRLLGLPGPRLSRPNPSVVNRQGGDPFALGLLHDLLGQFGQLPRRRPRPFPELLERRIRADPSVAASTPLACSIQTRLVSARRSWATSTSRLASSTPVLTSSAVTTASAPNASTSPEVHARGWVTYTSRVPTGWSASRTGTLNTPRTCSWPTTAASRSQTTLAL